MLFYIRYFVFCFLIIFTMVILTPILLIRPFNPKNTHMFFKVFEFFCKWIARIEVEIEGKKYIEDYRPAILIGNHQHNFDVVTVTKLFIPSLVVLGKSQMGWIPYFGQFYILAGNVLIKRTNFKKAMNAMDKVYKKLKDDKLSVLIFPEGHRNAKAELLPFKKGAYHTAVNTGFPLIPFAVSQFAVHENFNNWSRKVIKIKVFPPMKTHGLSKEDIPRLMEESRKTIEDGIKEVNQIYQ